MRYVFDRRKIATNTTPSLLQIEVREKGSNKAVLISTGVHLTKNQFSPINGFTCRNHDKAVKINVKVRKMFEQIEAFAASDRCQKLSDVKQWNSTRPDNYSFVDFIRTELAKTSPSYAVVEHHNSLITRLEEFGKIRTFSDLTYDNIHDFDLHLKKTISSKPTLYKRHIALRRYVTLAVRKGFCNYNPYDDFTLVKGKSKEPVFLVEEELKAIADYEPVSDYLAKTKDLFLLQCYTGLSYSDLMSFDASAVYEQDGFKVYRSNRNKTDESFICLLLPEAESILDRYGWKIPRISNQKYNAFIKTIVASVGINKVVTTHTGRHTFATRLLNKGVPIETVSRAIGHSSIRQTQHYARMLGKKVVADMSKILLG